jgi:excisionase family DNA binding protein
MMSLGEVARLYNINIKTARRLVTTGQLPASRIGGSLRVDPRAVADLVATTVLTPETPSGARESATRPKTAGGSEPPRHDRV